MALSALRPVTTTVMFRACSSAPASRWFLRWRTHWSAKKPQFIDGSKVVISTAMSQEAKAELRQHITEPITLRPGANRPIASGEWGLLGVCNSGGAGGQSRTAYAGLFRAALYR